MKPLSLREAVSQFHQQALNPPKPRHSNGTLSELAEQIDALRRTHEKMYRLRGSVGKFPPRPDTLRARVGALFVAIVRRMLFWYTPQIAAFNALAAILAEQTCLAFEKDMAAIQSVMREIQDLRVDLRMQTAGSHASVAATPAAPGSAVVRGKSGVDRFGFEQRNRPGGAADRARKNVRMYMDEISVLDPIVPAGLWIDLGANRGEWCLAAAAAGRNVIGIETNATAVDHCLQLGLDVREAEYSDWLTQVPDRTVAVVTAFHVLERYSFETVFRMVAQLARIAMPGGVLIVESGDTSNILNTTERLWQEPEHRILLPDGILTAVLRYYGFEIVRVRRLNPAAAEELFPWGELEVVERLNNQFHGPTDYSILARTPASGTP